MRRPVGFGAGGLDLGLILTDSLLTTDVPTFTMAKSASRPVRVRSSRRSLSVRNGIIAFANGIVIARNAVGVGTSGIIIAHPNNRRNGRIVSNCNGPTAFCRVRSGNGPIRNRTSRVRCRLTGSFIILANGTCLRRISDGVGNSGVACLMGRRGVRTFDSGNGHMAAILIPSRLRSGGGGNRAPTRGGNGWFIVTALATGGLTGTCGNHHIMRSIDLAIGSKRVINLLKPGNTNGAAAFCVIMNVIPHSTNGVVVSSSSVDLLPLRTHTHHNVNCLPRRTSVFHHLDICSGLVTMLRVHSSLSTRRHRSHTGRLVRRFRVRRLHSDVKRSLSKNRHHHMRVTHTLTTGPGFVLLSRPFTKISPVSIVSVGHVVRRLHSDNLNILVASRGIHRALTIYRHTCVIDRKRLVTRNAPARVLRSRRIGHMCLKRSFEL